jgi:ABC-2 type transport system ATP-binding protein
VRGLARDHAVVLSTHVLPDVLACCDRVAILHRGRLRHLGPLSPAQAGGLLRVGVSLTLREGDWLALPEVATVQAIDGRRWRVQLKPGIGISAFSSSVVERGFGLEELRAESAALEEVFLSIAIGDPAAAAA